MAAVSAAVAASPEMKTVHVPVIRADHHCLDAYVYYDKGRPLASQHHKSVVPISQR